MESSRKFFPTVVVLLLLVVVATEVIPAHARVCETKSTLYKGLCMKDHENCATMCRSEGFLGGECSGWHRDCMCTKSC
ncbi:defensin-like protein 1 [Phragmites australis]|uniref:defensin-like protein 1 n=1 Tax=Phragmites australis TaxID=29695 RepID=UPI002D77FD51|nr:defensin-like protein 1 [Phragmites australis]XP_062183661.1 defensin-like protein 1 [Phragmites australis]